MYMVYNGMGVLKNSIRMEAYSPGYYYIHNTSEILIDNNIDNLTFKLLTF